MWSTSPLIAAGDVVILWLTRDDIQPLTITPGKELNNKWGYYHHNDMIGIPFGSRLQSRNGRGYIHLLRPTPELWTLALPHRTQILYLADIAYVTLWLNMKPGSKVIEAGTGSGSFTHSAVRTIGPEGKLYSYEFNKQRYDIALEEFTQHKMMDTVTLVHRNVCKDGFTVEDWADAVFLDLPMPWEAIPHAKKALRQNKITRICCYSPCIEQVLETVKCLNKNGFTEICMYETLLRSHDVLDAPSMPTIDDAVTKGRELEVKKAEKRERQIAASAEKFRAKQEKKKEKRRHTEFLEQDALAVNGVDVAAVPETPLDGSEPKRVKIDATEDRSIDTDTIAELLPPPTEVNPKEDVSMKLEEGSTGPETELPADQIVLEEPDQAVEDDNMDEDTPATSTPNNNKGKGKGKGRQRGKRAARASSAKDDDDDPILAACAQLEGQNQSSRLVSKPAFEVRGHTSYLTFAKLVPWPIPELAEPEAGAVSQGDAVPSTSED